VIRHLACAETWSCNTWAGSLVELPGLAAWVHLYWLDRVTAVAMFITYQYARPALYRGLHLQT
jgi:hypothetical protein